MGDVVTGADRNEGRELLHGQMRSNGPKLQGKNQSG